MAPTTAASIGGDAPITILPGQRLVLVKSSKVASNGAEIWSLMLDAPGADDRNRVYENRSDVDLDNHRGRQQYSHMAARDPQDSIPF